MSATKVRQFLMASAMISSLAAGTSVRAEGIIFTVVSEALLCETKEQVEAQIDILSSARVSGVSAVTADGCEYLEKPSPAFVRPIGAYENKYAMAALVEITVLGLPTRYGYLVWVEKKPKPGA